jgi:hypothetical protein
LSNLIKIYNIINFLFFNYYSILEKQIEDWNVAYCGTNLSNLNNIINIGLFALNSILPNGKQISGSSSDLTVKGPIKISPSIEYSANWVHTDPTKTNSNEYLYAVFQVIITFQIKMFFLILAFITCRFVLDLTLLKYKKVH